MGIYYLCLSILEISPHTSQSGKTSIQTRFPHIVCRRNTDLTLEFGSDLLISIYGWFITMYGSLTCRPKSSPSISLPPVAISAPLALCIIPILSKVSMSHTHPYELLVQVGEHEILIRSRPVRAQKNRLSKGFLSMKRTEFYLY